METVRVVVMVASYAALAGALGVAAVVDLACRVVPNGCALVAAASGVSCALAGGSPACRGPLVPEAPPDPLACACLAVSGGVTTLAVMLVTAAVSGRVRGSPGVGGGDVKLLGAVGLWAGPVGGLVVIALACLVALGGWLLACGVDGLRGRRGPRGHAVAMAPAIGLATLVTIALVQVGAT